MATAVRGEKGDVFRMISATGGGYGNPAERPREQVLADLKNGYITAAQAKRYYGVADAG